MDWVIKIIGIVFVLIAVAYLLKPPIMKRLMEFFKKGPRIYMAGVIRFVLGILFLLAATECKKPWVIGGFGVLFLISALLIFLIGSERLRSVFEWWQKQSNLLLRVVAFITLAVGVVIIIFA
ncbi:MAG: hypothetical protein ACYTBJ_12685 [Planctomycetota bacterium]|jgi:hypothetical protein